MIRNNGVNIARTCAERHRELSAVAESDNTDAAALHKILRPQIIDARLNILKRVGVRMRDRCKPAFFGCLCRFGQSMKYIRRKPDKSGDGERRTGVRNVFLSDDVS